MAASLTTKRLLFRIGAEYKPDCSSACAWTQRILRITNTTKTEPLSTSAETAVPKCRPFAEMPGPKGLPLIGTILSVATDHSKSRPYQVQRCEDYFPIYKKKAGPLNFVVVLGLEGIEQVVRYDAKYPERMAIIPWLHYRRISGEADGILTANHEEWHRMRRVIDKPMLRIKDIASYTGDINSVLTDFLDRLDHMRDQDLLIPDLERELFNWSLESIGKVLYEKRFGGLSDQRDPEMQDFIDSVGRMLKLTKELMVVPMWFAKIFKRNIYKEHNRCWETLSRVARKCVDEKMNDITSKADRGEQDQEQGLLSYLRTQKSLSMEEIYSNVTELMLGAVDTTSVTVLWMLQELALNPHVQDKLLEEVNSVVPLDAIPNYEDLQKMPYLKAVVKETLRMYPVAAEVTRTLQEDMEICGYNVPAKTSIRVIPHVICRLPRYFKDPDTFKPERWLRGQGEEKVNPFLSLAFGFGTRMCIGRRLAELEINLLMSRLIREYSIEAGFTEPAEMEVQMVVRPDRPIKIRLIDRERTAQEQLQK